MDWKSDGADSDLNIFIKDKLGIEPCPYNRTVVRLGLHICNQMNQSIPDANFAVQIMRIDNMGAYERGGLFIVRDFDTHGVAPIALLMMADYLESDQLGVHCSEDCTPETCGVWVPGVKDRFNLEANKRSTDDAAALNEQFGHIVEPVKGEVPNFEDLAKYYDTPSGD